MNKADRTITLRGPFTDAEITEFWRLLQSVEKKNPAYRYSLVIDAPDASVAEAWAALDRVAPVAEGHARTKGFVRRKQ